MLHIKDKIYQTALQVYFKCEKMPVLAGVNLLCYRILACINNPNSRRGKLREVSYQKPDLPDDLRQIRVALIADKMTCDNLRQVCDCIPLTCRDWAKQMEQNPPHLFFCESAWLGNEGDGYCWRGQIYKNEKVWFENRKTVLDILAFCQKNGIPTVFYNKEDPTSFDDPYHNFVDLALRFDYLYTTAAECVEKYKALGARHCDCLPLGVSLSLYNPFEKEKTERKGAVFAGSWYAEFAERCADMCALFDMVLEAGIGLTIYDRYYGDPNPQKQFPAQYQKYVRPAVPYERLGEVLKQYEFALNINTVKDSDTMFARRVYEVMAERLYLLSNESVGMRRQFGKNVTYIGESIPDAPTRRKAVSENLQRVIEQHSFAAMFETICKDVGLSEGEKALNITCVGSLEQAAAVKTGYVYLGNAPDALLQKAVRHFSYLPAGVGICLYGTPSFYAQSRHPKAEDILFPAGDIPDVCIHLGY